MLRPPVLPTLLLLGACATPGDQLIVTLRVTGAIERSGTYAHAADSAHGCDSLATDRAPGSVPMMSVPVLREIVFNRWGEPPEVRFVLAYPLGHRPGGASFVWASLTAGGRLWEAPGDAVAELQPEDEEHMAGRFVLRGLRPAGGGDERIDVEGRWRCPAPRWRRGG